MNSGPNVSKTTVQGPIGSPETWTQYLMRTANDPVTISLVASISTVLYSTLRRRIDVNLGQMPFEAFKSMTEDRRYRLDNL